MEITELKLPSLHLTQVMLTPAIKTSIIVFSTIAVFFQDLTIILNNALKNETTTYILAVPFLLSYLVYRKRKMITAATSLEPSHQFPNEIFGALLLLAAFLIYCSGSITFSPLEYHLLALPIFVSACILILFNLQTLKQLIFPVAFLFLLVPPPAESMYYLGSLLSMISSNLAYSLVKFSGFPAELGSEYGTPIIFITQLDGTTISFAVDTACSGIYSLIGFFVFSLFVAYIVRDKMWKKLLIFLIGFPLMYLLNVVRIFSIIIIGYYFGLDLALTLFHLLGGWLLIFLGTILLLLITEKLFEVQIFPTQSRNCEEYNRTLESEKRYCYTCGQIQKINPPRFNKRELTKIMGLITITIIILSFQTPVFALTTGPAELLLLNPTGHQMTTEILPPISGYDLQFISREHEFEQLAGQDAALFYAYIPTDSTKAVIWVALEIAATLPPLHRWEICLITWPTSHGYQPTVNQIALRDVELLENPPIIGRYFVFQWRNSNLTEAVLYWYESSVFKLNTASEQKNVKISVITYPLETESLEQTETDLLVFGEAITNYWQPIKNWSKTMLVISDNSNILLELLLATLALLVLLQVLNQNRTKQKNFKVYQKLSRENQAIIDAVYQTKPSPTPINIATTYAKLHQKTLSISQLVHKLQEAKRVGLVNPQLANFRDEPVLEWKVQFSYK